MTNFGTIAIGVREVLYLAGTFANNAIMRIEGTASWGDVGGAGQ